MCLFLADNGFNPLWDDETFEFYVSCPSLALLRFAVYDLDMFGDNHLIAQATYPVSITQPFIFLFQQPFVAMRFFYSNLIVQ